MEENIPQIEMEIFLTPEDLRMIADDLESYKNLYGDYLEKSSTYDFGNIQIKFRYPREQ